MIKCDLNTDISNKKITAKGGYNKKPYFEINGGFVYWNIDANRWEFSTEKGGGTLISYLQTSNNLPIPLNGEKWISPSEESNGIVLSSDDCINYNICFFPGQEVYSKYTNSKTLNYFDLTPSCIVNGKLSYTFNNTHLIYFDSDDKKWNLVLISDNSNKIAYLDNEEYSLPIQNVSDTKNYKWVANDKSFSGITTLLKTGNDCPTYNVFENLCIRIDCDAPINLIFGGYDSSGNPFWVSGNEHSIRKVSNKWTFSSTTTQYKNYTIISDTTSLPPISGWKREGGTSKIIVTEGTCGEVSDFVVTKSDATCSDKTDGQIAVELICPNPDLTYEYSFDNGVTWSLSPIKGSLQANTYNVCVRSNTKSCKSVIINGGPTKESYTLEIVKGGTQFITKGNPVSSTELYTPFEIIVKNGTGTRINQLPPSVSITFSLLIEDEFTLYQQGAPTVGNLYKVENNGIDISPNRVNSTPVITQNTGQGCDSSETIVKYNETRTYPITISGNISLSGYVYNIQNNIIPTDPVCLNSNTLVDLTTIKFGNITKTCNCCDVTGGQSQEWLGCDQNCKEKLPTKTICCPVVITSTLQKTTDCTVDINLEYGNPKGCPTCTSLVIEKSTDGGKSWTNAATNLPCNTTVNLSLSLFKNTTDIRAYINCGDGARSVASDSKPLVPTSECAGTTPTDQTCKYCFSVEYKGNQFNTKFPIDIACKQPNSLFFDPGDIKDVCYNNSTKPSVDENLWTITSCQPSNACNNYITPTPTPVPTNTPRPTPTNTPTPTPTRTPRPTPTPSPLPTCEQKLQTLLVQLIFSNYNLLNTNPAITNPTMAQVFSAILNQVNAFDFDQSCCPDCQFNNGERVYVLSNFNTFLGFAAAKGLLVERCCSSIDGTTTGKDNFLDTLSLVTIDLNFSCPAPPTTSKFNFLTCLRASGGIYSQIPNPNQILSNGIIEHNRFQEASILCSIGQLIANIGTLTNGIIPSPTPAQLQSALNEILSEGLVIYCSGGKFVITNVENYI